MKKLLIILVCVMILGLFSCSGDDPLDQDTNPPTIPKLRPHLGDTGDPPVTWNNQTVMITDATNGIDVVSDGNFFQIPWEPFVDTDLSHVNVYRFSNHDPNVVVEVATNFPATNQYYLDTSNDLVERVWYSYFIHLYDASGNYSVSDTVSYARLAKSSLVSPENGEVVSPVGLTLKWYGIGTNASSFRALIWEEINNNEVGDLLMSLDIDVDLQIDPLEVLVPTNMLSGLPSGTALRWRIDAYDHEEGHDVLMGSESQERRFILE